MRTTPADSQPPQASASTNSAIRAVLSKTDEECQQNGDESSAVTAGDWSPDPKVAERFQVAPAGDKTTHAERPGFEPPRAKNRWLQRWNQCRHCSLWYAAPAKELNRGRRVFCSIQCAGDHATVTGKFRGENNPRWLGGVSKDNMRYRLRQKEREPFKEEARRLTANAIKRGELVRQPCEKCGLAKSEAHHDNYEKPLEVRWLCRTHHVEHHQAEKAAKVAAFVDVFQWRGKTRPL